MDNMFKNYEVTCEYESQGKTITDVTIIVAESIGHAYKFTSNLVADTTKITGIKEILPMSQTMSVTILCTITATVEVDSRKGFDMMASEALREQILDRLEGYDVDIQDFLV